MAETRQTQTRQTLFLYPSLNNLTQEKQLEISYLITSLKIIVNKSNEQIARILQNSSFAYIRCLPKVNIEELCAEIIKITEEAERIRICVIGYNEDSYEESYLEICNQYSKNELNISHLVGVKINTMVDSAKFYKPLGSPFDVIIETGLLDLENILVSIMLDISIYHYFSLSNDIRYRRRFSVIKMNGIRESKYSAEYGEESDLKKVSYLPFSYPYINRISCAKNDDISEIIDETLKEYFDFITKYVCTTITFNSYKELEDPYEYEKKGVLSSILAQLDTVVANLSNGNNYYVIIKDSCVPIIIHDDDNSRLTWLSEISEPLNDCSLFYIKIGV